MNNQDPITIVAFGDSITEAAQQPVDDRWPAILNLELQRRFPGAGITVHNAGVGGNTTREGLARIERDVLSHNPGIVLVEFGNDATPDPARHVTFDEFTANLDLIRTKVAQRTGGHIILLTFPPIINSWHCMYLNEFYQKNGGQDACQERYRELTRQYSRDHSVALLDIDKAMRQAMSMSSPEEFILKDGVHLTAQGNRLVASLVFEFVSSIVAGTLAKQP